jgi:hypothetical protein
MRPADGFFGADGAGRRRLAVAGVVALALALSACESVDVEQAYPEHKTSAEKKRGGGPIYTGEKRETIFGEGGFNFFGGDDRKGNAGGGGSGIAVNSYLWRASLDTVAFMPLSSADPFGGVIITDWYSPPEAPSERYKMSVYILGRELRADGIKVAVFRERATGAGGWVSSPVSRDTQINLENQILTRARQLRVASTASN